MEKYRIRFDNINWEKVNDGMERKIFADKNRRMRLVRFSDNFVETEWCLKEHLGYVLEGEMEIDFQGEIVEYKKGNGLCIEKGKPHKVIVKKGKFVEIILFEKEQIDLIGLI